MSANTSPIYTLTPVSTWAKVTAADTTEDGTSAGVVLCHTIGAAGGFCEKLIFQPISTSGSPTTNAAAGRVYMNNGSSVGTGTNNLLFKEITLPATSVGQTATSGAYCYELSIGFQIQANYQIYIGITSFASNTQWNVLYVGGDY